MHQCCKEVRGRSLKSKGHSCPGPGTKSHLQPTPLSCGVPLSWAAGALRLCLGNESAAPAALPGARKLFHPFEHLVDGDEQLHATLSCRESSVYKVLLKRLADSQKGEERFVRKSRDFPQAGSPPPAENTWQRLVTFCTTKHDIPRSV